MPQRRALRMLLLALAVASGTRGQTLPHFQTKSLSDREVALPDAARGHLAILILGFTRGSGSVTGAWQRQTEKDFGSDPRYLVFDVAVLEDVPRLFRGMVVGGIRKGMPPARRDRFLTAFQDEKLWKQVVHYAEPDDAYLILLDEKGVMRWQGHGAFGASQYAVMRDQANLLARK